MNVETAHPEPRLRARWYALAAGMLAQSGVSSLQQGLPAMGPLLRDAFELSLPALGALLAAASWGVMLTVYLWGQIADRWGERVVVATGLSGATLTCLAIPRLDSALGLGVALCLAGAMSGSAIAASGRAIMGWFPRDERGLALGLRQMAVPVGASFSALVLPAVALRHGLPGAFVALGGLCFAGAVGAVIALGPPPTAATAPRKSAPTKSPVRDTAIWRLSSSCGVMQWAQVAMNTFFAVILVEHQNIGYGAAAALLALVQVLSGLARVLAGWHSDRRGRRVPHLVAYGTALTLALLVAGALQSTQSPLAVAAIVLATVLSFAWNGLAFASVAELAGPRRAGTALGLHATLLRALTLPTAILFGWVSAHLGWTAAIVLLAIFPAAATALIRPLAAEEERRAQMA